MESKNRFPQTLENAARFPHSHRHRHDYSLSKKGIIVVREREKYLTLITVTSSKPCSMHTLPAAGIAGDPDGPFIPDYSMRASGIYPFRQEQRHPRACAIASHPSPRTTKLHNQRNVVGLEDHLPDSNVWSSEQQRCVGRSSLFQTRLRITLRHGSLSGVLDGTVGMALP